jgi:predicted PurR-regulated permease PerM
LAIIAIFTVICILVFPQLVSCIKIVITKLPASIDELIAWAKGLEILPESFIASLDEIDWMEKISYYAQILISGIGNIAQTVVNVVFSVFSLLVTAFLATIFAIYQLLGKRGLTKNAIYLGKRFIKKDHHSKVAHVLKVANSSFRQYIIGQCTEAVILGSLCALGMLVLRLPYVAMISSLIAFTALIPIAGAFIGGGVGTVMIFTISPIKALIFLIFLLILQQLENNIIFPKVVGTSLGMPSIWVLAAVTVGGGLAGVIGMILSVPLAATAYKLIGEYMEKCKKADAEALAAEAEAGVCEEKNENIEEKNEDSEKN